ncbi:ABC transporter permease [Nioella sp. MMSF_3534]|uniref:ABC transporter permease n=1 Tax=Nioella sp. MMSF_3534 TaxID=3046720 RepID=UPI00273E8193|nr:ABC transporter permease [Nioella sp. MMSF_3534]
MGLAEQSTIQRVENRPRLPDRLVVGPDAIRAAVLIVLLAAGALLTPGYLSLENFRILLMSVAAVGIVAYGMTLVVISGEIDLAVAGTAVLSAIVGATLLDTGSPVLVIGATLVTGLAIGLVNGVLTAFVGIPSLIVTLAMLGISRAVANIISRGQASYPDSVAAYLWFGNGKLLGLPTPIALLLSIGALMVVLTRFTTFGPALYATGGNTKAAVLSGIRARSVKLSVFMICGVLAATGGMIESARLSYINPAAFAGLELEALAITVLGGAALAGGSGSILGTLLAALIIGVVNNLLNQLGVSLYTQRVVTALVILAVVLPGYKRRQIAK